MQDTYWKALKRSCNIILFELYCHCCTIYGVIRAKLYFDKKNCNRLEIGIGNSPKKEGFISSDLNFSTDFPYDLRLGLPFPDDSIDYIYAEHVLEHFEYRDLLYLIKDCRRVLRKNGIMRVVVPDASIYIHAYNDPQLFDFKRYCIYDFGLSYKTRMDYVNFIFYMDGQHRYMFDGETLLTVLSSCAFRNVRLDGFKNGIDQEARKHESIYAECVK